MTVTVQNILKTNLDVAKRRELLKALSLKALRAYASGKISGFKTKKKPTLIDLIAVGAGSSNGSSGTNGSKPFAGSDDESVIAIKDTIVTLYIRQEQAKEQTRSMRKEWNQRIGEAREQLKQSCEAADDGTPKRARTKLDGITTAWQQSEELAAGKKSDLHECLNRERTIKKRIRKAFDSAHQMSLPGMSRLPSSLKKKETKNAKPKKNKSKGSKGANVAQV